MIARRARRSEHHLRSDIRRLDERIAADAAKDAVPARRAALPGSVPGIGPVVAHGLLALLPELGQLPHRALAALVATMRERLTILNVMLANARAWTPTTAQTRSQSPSRSAEAGTSG